MATENKNNSWERAHNRRADANKARARARQAAAPSQFIAAASGVTGLVASVGEGKCLLWIKGAYHRVSLEGKWRPVVGDILAVEEDGESWRIAGIVERRSFLARLKGDASRRSHAGFQQHAIAANVDLAVIVAAAANPEFHPRFIDRYLVISQNGGVAPAIALSKSDLTDKRDPMLAYYGELGIPVVETSGLKGRGIDGLRDLLRHKTAVLVGASGVGKSSLINALIPDIGLRVKEVSLKTGKGKHTTTGSNLYQWEGGSFIIDTPGIRSLGVEDLDKASLASYFPEFVPYLGLCKYGDCTHTHEPGCAIRQAAETGSLHERRYESYLRLFNE